LDYTRILKGLIAIDTTVPPGRNYEQAIDYLEPLFREVGFKTQKINIPRENAEGLADRVNLLAHRPAAGKPRLIIYGHIDVVPAEGWDAFNPQIKTGKIYGRGAADMKGAIVGLLLGLNSVKHKDLRYDISVMITTDEETNQKSQVLYLGQFLQPLAGTYFLSLDSSFGYVGITNLGVIQMDINVKGKSVHSALEHLGENAVEKASLLVQALLALKQQVARRQSSVDTNPESGLKKMEAKLNINMIQGGLKANIIPDKCLISLDRRLIPEENIIEAEKELMDTLASVKGVDFEITRVVRIPPIPPIPDPIIDELDAIIKEVTGASGKFGIMGSGDLPPIVDKWGGKQFSLGVIRAECNIHAQDEFAYLKDIEDLGKIIARFVTPVTASS